MISEKEGKPLKSGKVKEMKYFNVYERFSPMDIYSIVENDTDLLLDVYKYYKKELYNISDEKHIDYVGYLSDMLSDCTDLLASIDIETNEKVIIENVLKTHHAVNDLVSDIAKELGMGYFYFRNEIREREGK